MDSLQYCQEKAAQPGTDLYYSLLYVPAPQRNLQLALATFRQQVRGMFLGPAEPDAIRVQLSWWQQEIEKLAEGGHPDHPALQLLQDTGHWPADNRQLLHRYLIAGYELFLADPPVTDAEVFAGWQALGNCCAGIIREHTGDTGLPPAALNAWTTITEATDCLRQCRRAVSMQRIFWPRTGADEAGDLQAFANSSLYYLQNLDSTATATGSGKLPAWARGPHLQAQFGLAWLQAMSEENFSLLTTELEISPLRKLLASWRARFLPAR